MRMQKEAVFKWDWHSKNGLHLRCPERLGDSRPWTAHKHFVPCLVQCISSDTVFVVLGSAQSSLIDHITKVCTAKPWRSPCQGLCIHVGPNWLALHSSLPESSTA